ncbi:MAG TPA: hypothetical protein VLL47_08545 [Robiginitalea sp.]|nr:hypothetical protein [Robiginitalea sp.]
MKKWSVLPVAAALLFSASALATEGETKADKEAPKSKICTEIKSLLKDNNIVLNEQGELDAWVRFTVNEEREMVVLTVRTENDAVERFVKAKLNYQSVGDTNLQPGETYDIPIRFKS